MFVWNTHQGKKSGMQVNTILNRIQRQPGFVYGRVELIEERGHMVLGVKIWPRARNRALCSGCGQRQPGYDTLSVRRFQFVHLWGIALFFLYPLRPVDCPECEVKVERVLWAQGKSYLTTTYAWFLVG